MNMNKVLQVRKIRELVKREGVEPDTIDIEAYVDGSLTFPENWRNIKEDLPYLAPANFEIGTKRNPFQTQSSNKIERFLKAKDYHDSRSIRARRHDNRREAQETWEPSELTKKKYNKWRKHPNRYDIRGVDCGGHW